MLNKNLSRENCFPFFPIKPGKEIKPKRYAKYLGSGLSLQTPSQPVLWSKLHFAPLCVCIWNAMWLWKRNMNSIHQFLFILFPFFPLPIYKSFQLRLTVKQSTVSSLDILGLSLSSSIKAAWSLSDFSDLVWLWLLIMDCGFVFVCLFCSTVFCLFFVCELWLISNKVGLLEFCDLELFYYISINLTVFNGGNIYFWCYIILRAKGNVFLWGICIIYCVCV